MCSTDNARFNALRFTIEKYESMNDTMETQYVAQSQFADSSSTPLMIIVKGIDGVEEKIALLNSLADQLNDGSATIQFKGAREGSLILKVTVLNRVLQHQQNLMCDLMHFLEHVFKIGNIHELHVETVVDVIIAVEEVSFEINDFETAEEFYSSSDGSHSLLMDLEVDNEILLASNTLQESIGGFLENILTKTQLFPEKEVTAILLPGANESTSRGNNFADIHSTTAVNSLIQNMDINQETEQAQALTYKSEFELLTELGLKMYYPDKIGIFDIIKIQGAHSKTELSNIPWVFLEKMISINFEARDKILEEYLELFENVSDECNKQVDILDDFLGNDDLSSRVNPTDLTIAVFKCCSPVVKQIIASKMFMCRLAIPFVFPQSRNEAMFVSVWPIRPIVIEREESPISAVDCPCNVVSFVRMGYSSVSKSRMINEIISDQYHCTFFNKDRPLGSTTRRISNGLIEIAWYVPSTNSRLLSNVTVCLNLRGDCDVHKQQVSLMTHLSDAIVIMVEIYELKNKRLMQLLTDVYNTNVMVILSIDAIKCNKGVLRNELKTFLGKTSKYKDRTKINITAVDGHVRSFSDLKKEIKKFLSDLVVPRPLLSLGQRLQTDIDKQTCLDENKIIYNSTKEAAYKITSHIPTMHSGIKAQLVPLQGKPWKEWSINQKSFNKSSTYKTLKERGIMSNKMTEARRAQLKICENLGPLMSTFIETIQHFLPSKTELTVLVMWLKIFFDDRSRNILPKYLAKYKSKWQDLKSAQDQNGSALTIERLCHELSEREFELADASFGFEHLCREMGQMYEANIECNLLTSVKIRSVLPEISSTLLLLGHPFEVMDGDTANVPLLWIKAVLEKLREMIGDKKLLTLSVLGIQSSGKSTLLNTMFGLQFAVSAGRCTRGVFMQLVPARDETKAYDYVLVIDTEGLRAPELALEKYSHDNELATFVIGLGDVTIVNAMGENTAEIQDVLQIVVHAFLRLKLANDRINLKQKCVFVHQNVSATDANDKMIQQRKRFVEILDKMTQEAACEENIADINAFSQVIDFDSEENVWYFSDLWQGDPPMAPVNLGYSKCVQKVKNALFFSASMTERETYLTITDTISRIEDLWVGILKDDFVFSFRNSLEVKAYNSMERHCQSLTWSLEKFVLEFVRSDAKSILVNCLNDTDLEQAFSNIVARVPVDITQQVTGLCKELDSFVERSTLKDVMIQWIENKKTRFKMIAEQFVFKAKTYVRNIKEEIKVQRLKIREKTNHEIEINMLATKLAVKMHGNKPDKDNLEDEFNHFWSSWINQLGLKDDIEIMSIADQIENLLYDKFPSDAAFFKQNRLKEDQPYDVLKKIYGSISESSISKEHFSRSTSWKFKLIKEKSIICRHQTVDIVNQTFRKIDSKLLELDSQDIRFDISYVTELMNIIVNDIDSHNDHIMNDYRFNLLPPFRAMIVNHVAMHVTPFFTKLNERYNKKHSPKGQMESYKGTAWSLFINLVEEKTEDVIAAGFFNVAIIKTIVEHVTLLLPIDVQEYILLLFSNAKFSLMKDIMVYLANTDDFDEYKSFIKEPSTFANLWITKFTNDIIFKLEGNVQITKYADFANKRIHEIFCQLSQIIQVTDTLCSEHEQSDIKQWIEYFLKSIGDSNYLPLSSHTLIHVQGRNVSDITNFSKMLLDNLKLTESEVLATFQTTTAENVQWSESPIPKIMNRLWGCEAKCMFCFETCKNTDKDHISLGFAHQCIQHRPIGIRGFRDHYTHKMVISFCNYNVSTDKRYRWNTTDDNEEWKFYKEYKKRHPDWDIFPSSDVSRYWMWVICRYHHQLVEMYSIEHPDIPSDWWKITKEQAIKSISNTS
ncbi:interferon-induced very large GTPase 1-like [Mytilus edulis]|uniref:interferon-induced very large GTPase 1-like n=1 Tax=Mytilus edulis TaxID=6550 RepID=UPI0039F0ED07